MFVQFQLLRTSCFLCCLLIPFLSLSAHAIPSSPCPLDDGTEVTSRAGQEHLLQVGEAGWLLLEVEAAAMSTAWYEVITSPCAQGGAQGILDRGFDQGLLWLPAGEVGLRFGAVQAENGRKVSLRTHFVADSPWWKDGDEEDDTETGAAEIVPRNPGGRSGLPTDKDGEEEDDTETGAAEIVPVQQPSSTDPWAGCIDGAEPFNDFGLCATPLAVNRPRVEALGELRHDDRDYFRFTVQRSGPVSVALQGDLPLRATLLLDDGRAVHQGAMEAEGGALKRFELDAHLLPGTYLVRVEGAEDAVGTYDIEVRHGA